MWYDLLLMAGASRTPGIVQATNNRPYPLPLLAAWLAISEELLQRTLQKCEEAERIQLNGGSIRIVNWDKYQSNYNGQKTPRDGPKPGPKIHKICKDCGYKGKTDLQECPNCGSRLERDYQGGIYGKNVQQ